MKLCRVRLDDAKAYTGVFDGDRVELFPEPDDEGEIFRAVLFAEDPEAVARKFGGSEPRVVLWDEVEVLPPMVGSEVWAAGVTYRRSKDARQEESQGAGDFYAKVYGAARPELFFKADRRRVVGHRGKVRLRRDTAWCVPEPELAVLVSPDRRVVGYTIGDDVSCRDIEGENPLYLPQAKVFADCCALGPVVTTANAMPDLSTVRVRLEIWRGGRVLFQGATSLREMVRPVEELVDWLFREQDFPEGVTLLTGTGIVPPDDFSLAEGDWVGIEVDGIGRLETGVYQLPARSF
jgi:2-dehydro-3-deoxy-D-arabinonate dehydratase